MKVEQEWENLRNKLNGERYDWDTCFINAKKRRNRDLIIKYVGAVLLLVIICSVLCYVVYPEKVYDNILSDREIVVYVDDIPQLVSYQEEMVEVLVSSKDAEMGTFELVLPRSNSMKGLWQMEEASAEVEVISSEQIWDGQGRLGLMLGAYHAMQRMVICVDDDTEGTFLLKVEYHQGEPEEVTVHYICTEGK